jgi:hypothetical protein
MKDPYFDYGRVILERSPLIYNWAQNQNLEFFDFDNLVYAPERAHLVQPHIESVAKETNKLIIVEQHPFFDIDESYLAAKNYILQLANDLRLQLYFLTADYRNWDDVSKRECFYPHWYFELRTHAFENDYKQFHWPTIRKYNFSCNNRSNLRAEKIYNYIECFRRYRPDWLLSIYDHKISNDLISNIDITRMGQFKTDQIDIWNKQIKHTLKQYQFDLYLPQPLSSMNTLFPGHVDAYCNLVMEHSMEIEILSEKSFKPFVAKQIPVYLAHTGACNMLTKLGFDLFYDFVDHARYDSISQDSPSRYPPVLAWMKRIEQVHQLLDNLYTTNFTDFINDTGVKQRLEKNCDHFYSNNIDLLCIERINQLLNN